MESISILFYSFIYIMMTIKIIFDDHPFIISDIDVIIDTAFPFIHAVVALMPIGFFLF